MQDFHFSRRERQGLALIVLFLLGSVLLPEIPLYSNTKTPSKPLEKKVFNEKEKIKTSKETKHIDKEEKKNSIVKKPSSIRGKQYFNKKTEQALKAASAKEKPKYFDPNSAPKARMIAAGIPKRLANTIVKYRNKKGVFNKKEDLLKIYGMKQELYDRVAPFVKIKARKKKEESQWKKLYLPAKVGEHAYTVRDSNKLDIVKMPSPVYFKFDPNTASEQDLQRLGLSDKAVQNLMKYRAKGGTFYKKEQLQKIYGLKEATYLKIKDYIDLPSSKSFQKFPKKTPIVIDVNQADATAFQQLRGIGPSYSKRIIKFRNALGGFHRIEQVAETWGLPDSTFQSIKPFLKIKEKPSIKQIALNEADVDILKAHPYINWKKAGIIMNYKKQHGDFESVEGLKDIRAISAEMYAKIAPYLKI